MHTSHYAIFCKCGKVAKVRGVCRTCYQASKSVHSGMNLTENEKKDIRRRMRNFEAPAKIAAFYGVTTDTILRVMK